MVFFIFFYCTDRYILILSGSDGSFHVQIGIYWYILVLLVTSTHKLVFSSLYCYFKVHVYLILFQNTHFKIKSFVNMGVLAKPTKQYHVMIFENIVFVFYY